MGIIISLSRGFLWPLRDPSRMTCPWFYSLMGCLHISGVCRIRLGGRPSVSSVAGYPNPEEAATWAGPSLCQPNSRSHQDSSVFTLVVSMCFEENAPIQVRGGRCFLSKFCVKKTFSNLPFRLAASDLCTPSATGLAKEFGLELLIWMPQKALKPLDSLCTGFL